jgi:hypothetical protein
MKNIQSLDEELELTEKKKTEGIMANKIVVNSKKEGHFEASTDLD